MGIRTQNIKSLFSDARTRTILVITLIILLIAVISGYFIFRSHLGGPASTAVVEGAPPSISGIPGSFQPTPEYAKLVEQENIDRATEAQKTGNSAIPTIIRAVRPGEAQAVTGAPGQPWQTGLGFQQLAESQSGTPKAFALDAVQQNACDPKDLQAALKEGVSLSELRQAGCSAKQLRDAGFTPEQLQQAGFSACDLIGSNGISPTAMKNAGYTAGELRGVGYNACQLKNAGFSLPQLLRAGFNPAELQGVGFSPNQIAETQAQQGIPTGAGEFPPETIPGLPAGVTAQALKAAGCGAAAIRQDRSEGVSAAALRAIGCTAADLKAGGFTAKDLKDAGFTAGQLRAAGFSAADLKNAGYTPAQLRAAGFTPNELRDAGFTPAQLEEAGFNPAEATGVTSPGVLPPGITEASLRAAGCSPTAVAAARSEGVSAAELKKIGCTASELKGGGYTATQLRAAGFTPQQLKDAGFTAQQLKDAGFTAGQLKDAGFTPQQLKNAGFTAGQLRNAGFTPSQLKDAGYSAAELKDAGFSPGALSNANFTPSQLKAAGYTAAELRAAGLSPGQLNNAGYTPEQLKNAGFTAAELAAAGLAAPTIPETPPRVATAMTAPVTELALPPVTPPGLESTAAAQQQQLQQQQNQQLQTQIQSAISNQVNQLFTAWRSPDQQLVEGVPPTPAEQAASGVIGVPGAPAGPVVVGQGPPLIKAGTIMFAILTTSVDSDYPGPVLANIVSGRFAGARLIGSMTTFGQFGKKVMLTFDKMNSPGLETTIDISAVAIDPDTARTALSSYTNEHYFLKYGTLFAASFLEGYGQAFLQSGQTVISNGTATTVTSPDLNAAGKLYVALGNVGNKFGSQLEDLFDIPPTVHVYSGTSLGILFTEDVARPAPS